MRMWLALTSFFLCFFHDIQAQTSEQWVKEALRYERLPDEKKALACYQQAYRLSPRQLDVLYACSELCSRIGNREKATSSRDRYYASALSYARQAFQLYPESDVACLAMSIAMGRIALTKSGKEKITTVKDIRNYAEKALAFNPANYKAWHVLGKWHYEVSNLNFMEKAAVRLFFGGLPESSFEASVRAYETAARLQPQFPLNDLELAKSYYKSGQRQKAVQQLKRLNTLPLLTEDDPRIRQEGQALLRDWQ